MVKDLHFPINVVVGETIREPDGLAMSSRNRYLSASDRALAPILYKGMQAAIQTYKSGVRDRKSILASAEKVISETAKSSAASSAAVKLEYLSLAEPIRLEEVQVVDANVGAILSGAIRMPGSGTRIIDNVLLGMQNKSL